VSKSVARNAVIFMSFLWKHGHTSICYYTFLQTLVAIIIKKNKMGGTYRKHERNEFSRVPRYTGFGLIIGFADNLQIVTTSNYNTISNSHDQQFSTAFSVCCVFTSRCLVTASNGGRSPYSAFPTYHRP
jgi:hypothetical protein